jgi:quinol monooxygenase YgiN
MIRPPASILETAMLHVVAIVTAKPGKRDAILEAIRANLPAVRAEIGCVEYGPAVDVASVGPFQTNAGPDTVFVIEKWADEGALKAHAAAPHMAAYAAKVKDLVASRVIHVLRPAE